MRFKIVSNKKASLIAIIFVVVVFLIYDRFKPLSEEKYIAKQGAATVFLDNSYKNIDSKNSPEGTLLAQYSNRHALTVLITGSHIDTQSGATNLPNYLQSLVNNAPEGTEITIIETNPEISEAFYTLTTDKITSWQRLKLADDAVTIISVVSETQSPSIDPMAILNTASFEAK